MIEELEEMCKIKHFVSVQNNHCNNSYSCCIVTEDFGKIVFSGDTKRCKNLVNYAKNASVLVHVATLPTGKEKDANSKNHCTMQ